MDSLTKLLLRRYAPNDPRLTESSGALAAVAKSTASLPNASGIKVSPEALEKATGMTVIMSANEYDLGVIFTAIAKFNRDYPEYLSRSFMLPIGQNGIPKDSWVLLTSEDD